MKEFSRLLIGSLFASQLLALAALADTKAAATNIKIGFVNFEAAFSQEAEASKYTKELEAEDMKIGRSEQKARGDIETKMASFRGKMSKLSEKARQEQEQSLSQEIGMLQQKFTQERAALNQKRQDILKDLETKNRLLIESISRKNNYDLVLNAATMVYVSDRIKKNDLTQNLIAEYNKAYPVETAGKKKSAKKGKK